MRPGLPQKLRIMGENPVQYEPISWQENAWTVNNSA